jgi:hypothetical protein
MIMVVFQICGWNQVKGVRKINDNVSGRGGCRRWEERIALLRGGIVYMGRYRETSSRDYRYDDMGRRRMLVLSGRE